MAKLNNNQLECLFNVITNSHSGRQFWDVVYKLDFDTGYGIKNDLNWEIKGTKEINPNRCALVANLRQLADAIEANPAKTEYSKVVKKVTDVKKEKVKKEKVKK
jgi:hypothetical protein